jgi:protein arginine kinase activator
MICESCHKYDATVIYTHIVENKIKTVNLCSSCAPKEGGILGKEVATAAPGKKVVVELSQLAAAEGSSTAQCAECGMTYEEFKKAGRFGCQGCYSAFEEQMERLLKRIHGSARHCGKGKVKQRVLLLPEEEIAQLRQELEAAVAEEAFERAAQLRDRIVQLEKKTTG